MAYQPWIVGQIDPMLIIPLMLDSGAENITGASISDFSLSFRRANGVIAGTGQLAIMQQNPGSLIYKLSPQDVASAGSGLIEIQQAIPSPGNPEPVNYDPIWFNVSTL